jgi:hypothetical protein
MRAHHACMLRTRAAHHIRKRQRGPVLGNARSHAGRAGCDLVDSKIIAIQFSQLHLEVLQHRARLVDFGFDAEDLLLLFV